MRLKDFQEIPSRVGNVPVFKQIYGLQFNPKTRQQEGETRICFGDQSPSLLDIAFEKVGELQLAL